MGHISTGTRVVWHGPDDRVAHEAFVGQNVRVVIGKLTADDGQQGNIESKGRGDDQPIGAMMPRAPATSAISWSVLSSPLR